MALDFLHLDYHGIRVIMNPQFQELGKKFLGTTEFRDLSQKLPSDTIIALGGDGTFLETVHMYFDFPILGIHFGTRGFLIQKKEEVLSASGFVLDSFPLIETKIGNNLYHAGVNEIVIKGTAGHVIDFTVKLGAEVIPLRADGCMIVTALGSTGYNTSLGGPILLESSSWILTPIASLSPRQMNPIVFSHSTAVEIELHQKRETEIGIYRDGEEIFRGSSSEPGIISLRCADKPGKRLIPFEKTQKSTVSSFFSLL